MDPIEGINIDANSTFALMLEAQARGHALWHYEVRHMSLREGVAATGRQAGRSGCSPGPARSPSSARAARITGSASWRCSTSARWTWC